MRLLPDRGLDIGAAWFRGTPLAWISPVRRAGRTRSRRPGRPRLGRQLVRRPRHDVWAFERRRGVRGAWSPRDLHGPRGDGASPSSGRSSEVTADCNGRRPTVHAGAAHRDDGRSKVSCASTTASRTGRNGRRPRRSSTTSISAPHLWDDGTYLETDAQDVVPRDEDAAAGSRDVGRAACSGARGSRTRLRARRRIVGAADEPPTRARGDRTLVTPTPLAMGPPRERGPTRSPSSRRTARCWGVPTTSPPAGCRSSTRARPAPPGSRSKRGPCDACGVLCEAVAPSRNVEVTL